MTNQKIDIFFSLLFFFFSSFLFLSILSSTLIDNFENLLLIMLRPNGFFISATRFILFCGFVIAIYLYQSSKENQTKKYKSFILFGSFLFLTLFLISIFSYQYNFYENVLEIYSYNANYSLFNSVKELVFDVIIFIYFITIPAFSFFYKKKIYDSYFYQTYIREITPSFNVSIIFLFGYVIQKYNFSNFYSIIDFALSVFSVTLFIRIAIILRKNITLYSVVNVLILFFGFIIFIISNQLLQNANLHFASFFFYSIGLLYWFLNILLKL